MAASTRDTTPIAPAGRVAVETIVADEGLARLGEQWNELLHASAADTVFLTWEWLSTWWRHLAGGRQLRVMAVRRAGTLVAIAPLALGRPALGHLVPFRSLEFLGGGSVGSDYLDLVIRRGHEAAAAAALAGVLGEQRRSLCLAGLDRRAPAAAALGAALARRGWTVHEQRIDVCPFVDLAGRSWPAYLASLDGRHRSNVKRRTANLERKFSVRLERARTEPERREALAILVDLHRRRWRERGGSNALDEPAVVDFHEDFTRLALRRGWLRLLVLRLDEEPVAALYGLRYRERFCFYQIGFDPAYARHGVGQVLVGLAIRSAIEEDAAEFDFLHGDESYKFDWTARVRELGRLILYPRGLRGFVHRRLAALGAGARELARRARLRQGLEALRPTRSE